MINNDINEKLVERLINRIEKLNENIIFEIGSSIKKIGLLAPSDAHKIKQMLIYGESLDKIAQLISKVTKLNVQDIYDIFEEEAKINQGFAQKFYEFKKIDFIPYEKNEVLQSQVKAIAKMTAEKYINLSNTTVMASYSESGDIVYKNIANTYRDTIDKAILSLTQGKESFNRVMSKSMKLLSRKGLQTVEYKSGHHKRLDSAVRMNILDSMRQLSNELQQQFGQEFEADGVEISVHKNPAPDHANVQGHQFSNEEYQKLQNGLEVKDYKGKKIKIGHSKNGSFRPISQYNCYHYIFSIILGVSEPEYSQKELNRINEENKKGFEFEEQKYTMYEGTQLQRKIETKIRKQKDMQIGAKAMGNLEEAMLYEENIGALMNKYKELSDISGLPTKYNRIKVEGYKEI